jgi:hypothetical protein
VSIILIVSYVGRKGGQLEMNYKIHSANYVKISIFILTMALGFIFFGFENLSAKRNQDIFSEILKQTNVNIQQCSITTSFDSRSGGFAICEKILKRLGYGDASLKVTATNNIYRIEFLKDNYYGYIESTHDEKEYSIVININDHCSKNDLNKLKLKMNQALNGISSGNKDFLYIRSKIATQSISTIDSKIKSILKDNQAIDVNSVNINNGITTTAYTGLYSSIKSGSSLMDFNYAVCRYSSGNYLIMGSPEIIATY